MKARLCRLSLLCVMCVNKQPTPSDKKYWYWERMGGEMALCLWTCVELNLEERERERCHLSVKRLANKSWQSQGREGGEKIWRSMSQRAIKQKKDEVSFLFFFFFASFSWPYFSTASPSVYLEPAYNYLKKKKITPALLSTVERNPGAFNPLVGLVWMQSKTTDANKTTKLWSAWKGQSWASWK